MSELENTKRIYGNLRVLLSTGNFPGSMAAPLAEAQSHVEAMINKLDEKAKDEPAQQEGAAPSSVRDEKDASGLAGNPSGSEGRPRRARKSKRAGEPGAGA